MANYDEKGHAMFARALAMLLLFGAPAAAAAKDCIGIEEAPRHIGRNKCVAGTVKRVNRGQSGVTFINFCEDYKQCPFSAVVFPRDLRHVGDVSGLAGQRVEIEGKIRQYDGRPEIIVKRAAQLGGIPKLPPVPKQFDAQRHGSYSAGQFSHPQAAQRPANGGRRSDDAGIPAEEPVEE
jgi:hypothetical protein